MNNLENLIKEINSYKNIAIWGYGREGKAFHNFIKKFLPNKKITIIENNEIKKSFDLIIKSPGISLYKLDIKYSDFNFSSSTELFLKHFGIQTIGITGTKGKSTTTKFLTELIPNSIMVGNIGVPVFEKISEIRQNSWIIFELSSHQLQYCQFSPKIAIVTNLFEEHLDYYSNKNEYFKSKMNIFKNSEIAIFDKNSEKFISKFINNSKIVTFNKELEICNNKNMIEINENFIHCDTIKIALVIATILNIKKEKVFKLMNNFKSLPHRLEFVTKIDGVKFYNDSISTIPESAINGIKTINPDTVIIGGDDRGVNYDNLIQFLNQTDIKVISIYESGEKIHKKLKNSIYCENLESAVKKGIEISKKVSLFSPASASYNHFKNFEERGEKFKTLLKII